MKLRDIFDKYKDVIPYGIFGVLTTVVNIITYWFMAHPLHCAVMVSTVGAWCLSVLFAYLTNRKWVFHSEAVTRNEIIKEIIQFFLARMATGIIDWLCMFVFVDLMQFDDVVIKTAANVIVIILNYVASKLIIFKKKEI